MTIKVCYWDSEAKEQKERDATPEEVAEIEALQAIADSPAKQQEIINKKIQDLWNAADAYIYQYINGVGLSILAAGVFAGHPKAKAVAAWSDEVWLDYYDRRSLVSSFGPVDTDYSSHGPIPYDVLELRAEIDALWQS